MTRYDTVNLRASDECGGLLSLSHLTCRYLSPLLMSDDHISMNTDVSSPVVLYAPST